MRTLKTKHTAGPGPNQRLTMFGNCLSKNPSSSSPSMMHLTWMGHLHLTCTGPVPGSSWDWPRLLHLVCCLHQTWSLTLSSLTSTVCARPEIWCHCRSKNVIHLPCRLQISHFQGCKISIMTSDGVQWNVYGAQPCSSDKMSAAVICSSMAKCKHNAQHGQM